MKNLATVMAMAAMISLPMAANAADDDEVTIRVMEMNEVSSDAVMQQIELPEVASDQAQENGQPGHRERERIRQMNEQGDQEMIHEGEMEQLRERMMEQHQEQQNMQPDVPENPGPGDMQGPGGPGA